MEVNHLREFVVLAKTMNFTAAAKELFLAQSTLSQHMRKLESDLGFSLIDRTTAASLTPQGELFLLRCQLLLHSLDDTLRECRAMSQESSRLPIRVYNTSPFDISPDRLSSALPAGAEIDDTAFEHLFYQCDEFTALEKDLVDVAVTYLPEGQPFEEGVADAALYDMAPLDPIRVCTIMGKDHPLARAERFHDVESLVWPSIAIGTPAMDSATRSIEQQTHQGGLSSVSIRVRSVQSTFGALQAQPNSVAFFFEGAAEAWEKRMPEDLVMRKFEDLPIVVRPFAICRKDNPNPQAHELMQTLVEEASGVAK